MRIAVLGTGVVGRALSAKLRDLGHEVRVGSRSADKGDATFAGVAADAELLVNATAGTASLEAIGSIAREHLAGKVLVDVANPLDFSQGMPPRLSVANDDSLGEQIQREFPEARVVKALNTMNCEVMIDPSIVPSRHTVFVCGEDPAAKEIVKELIASFGWAPEDILDLGGIEAARGTEMYLPLWLRMMGAVGGARFNIAVQRA